MADNSTSVDQAYMARQNDLSDIGLGRAVAQNHPDLAASIAGPPALQQTPAQVMAPATTPSGQPDLHPNRMPGETFPEEMYTPEERAGATGGAITGLDRQKLEQEVGPTAAKVIGAVYDYAIPALLAVQGGRMLWGAGSRYAATGMVESASAAAARTAPEAALPAGTVLDAAGKPVTAAAAGGGGAEGAVGEAGAPPSPPGAILDATGKPITAPPAETPAPATPTAETPAEVVTPGAAPAGQIYYHGTSAENAPALESSGKFDVTKAGTGADAAGPPMFGQGIYLSKSPDYAGVYKFGEEGGKVFTTELAPDAKIAKPTDLGDQLPVREKGETAADHIQRVNDVAKQQGYDGVDWGADVVLFNPDKVQSVRPYTPSEGGAGVPPGGAAPPGAQPAAPLPQPTTPAGAAQSLAQRQLDNLKAVRTGKATMEEFGAPEAATVVPEQLTLQESQALRQNLESYYAQGKEPPQLAAHVQALATTYQQENEGIHALNLDIRRRAAAGEDVTEDLNQLVNRFSAMAENYSTLAGTRSDVGRSLEILNPNKPGNAFVAATSRLAQQIGIENDPRQLSDLLSGLSPEQFSRVGRQMSEDLSLGRSLYNAFHEYYVDNLLSNAGRTSSRIGLSNSVNVLLQLPTRALQSLMPGSGVEFGEPAAGIQGLVDGFWHATDVGLESAKQSRQLSQIETGAIPEGDPWGPRNAISSAAFGLGNVDPATGSWEASGIGKGVDYLGNVLRLPGRAITGVHQFGHSMAYSMAKHMAAWGEAMDTVRAEGLNGPEGYQRAQEVYQDLLQNTPAELRLNAAKEADTMTFVNKLEGPAADVQAVFKYPVLKQLMPFFKVAYNVKMAGLNLTPGVNLLTQAPDLLWGSAGERSAASARIAMGAMFSIAIAHEFHQGNLELDKYGSPKIRLGDRLISVPPPLDVPIGTVGNYLQNVAATPPGPGFTGPTLIQKASAYARALGSSLANDSIVQSLVNLKKLWVDVAEDKPKALEQYGGEQLSGLVPFSALQKGVALGTDPYKRNPQTVLDEIMTGIPGQSERVEPQVDIFNKPVPNPTLGLPERLIYPVNVTKIPPDPIANEIARLDIKPPYPPSYLNRDQAARWSERRAEGLHDELSAYINNPAYKQLSDQFNKARIQSMIAAHTHVANVMMLTEPGLSQLILDHKLALKGLQVQQDQQAPLAHIFGVQGPASTVVPPIVQPDESAAQ
jgi:hypothetical protein